METIELEKTYLAKSIPAGLAESKYVDIADSFFPESARHPHLRLRRRGDMYEITKKQPVDNTDISKQVENTIPLSLGEYENLYLAGGKKFAKRRYQYPYQGRFAEVDVYQEDLSGLVIVDFEFDNEAAKNSFVMPDFCLVEVTQNESLAGGVLCGKKYSELEPELTGLGYSRINL